MANCWTRDCALCGKTIATKRDLHCIDSGRTKEYWDAYCKNLYAYCPTGAFLHRRCHNWIKKMPQRDVRDRQEPRFVSKYRSLKRTTKNFKDGIRIVASTVPPTTALNTPVKSNPRYIPTLLCDSSSVGNSIVSGVSSPVEVLLNEDSTYTGKAPEHDHLKRVSESKMPKTMNYFINKPEYKNEKARLQKYSFNCTFCKRSYKYKENLQRHTQKKHGHDLR